MIKGQFAKNLHKAVSERGIKQVELAKAVNVPATTVSGWFRGAHLPDIEKLMEICDYLDMPVGNLVSDKRGAKAITVTPTDADSKQLWEVVNKQQKHISNLEDENEELTMENAELMRQLSCDVEMEAEDTLHKSLLEVVGAGVRKITLEF